MNCPRSCSCLCDSPVWFFCLCWNLEELKKLFCCCFGCEGWGFFCMEVFLVVCLFKKDPISWVMPKVLAFSLGKGSESVTIYIISLCCWSEVKGNSVCFAWLHEVKSFCILALLPVEQGWAEKARQQLCCWIWALACSLWQPPVSGTLVQGSLWLCCKITFPDCKTHTAPPSALKSSTGLLVWEADFNCIIIWTWA